MRFMAVEKGGVLAPQPHPPFPWENYFSLVISENIQSLDVKNMWDFSLFIEQDVSDKK